MANGVARLLEARVALVTGAARGLGAEIAAQMAAQGATVVRADKRTDEADVFPLDVTDADEWAGAVSSVVDRHGRLDVLVNNAGIIRVKPLLETEPDEFRKVVETNLVGTFLGIRAAAPAMAASGGGAIVNLASPAGTEGTARMAAYGSSKWAIRGLTRTAAIELGPMGIRVNAVIPGPMRTAMTRRPGWEHEDYARHYGSLPLGRMGGVDEVARLVVWLASDEASYCTGGEHAADGGVTAGPPAG